MECLGLSAWLGAITVCETLMASSQVGGACMLGAASCSRSSKDQHTKVAVHGACMQTSMLPSMPTALPPGQ